MRGIYDHDLLALLFRDEQIPNDDLYFAGARHPDHALVVLRAVRLPQGLDLSFIQTVQLLLEVFSEHRLEPISLPPRGLVMDQQLSILC